MSAGMRSTPSGWCRMPLAGAQRLVHEDAAHRVREGKGQLVPAAGCPRLMVRLAWGSASTSSTFFPGLRQPDA